MPDNAAATGFRNLEPVLAPRSIVIVGASDQPGNLGGVAVGLLSKYGYAGDVWPLNPGRDVVGGRRCYRSLADLPASADLAIIATGAASVPAILRECAAAGTRYGIVWAGGFAEVGDEGAALQAAVAAACVETGFTLVGPNCIGIVNTAKRMTATFASFLVDSDSLVPGNIAIISQSGGIATMAQALAQAAGFGFSYMISSGNEAMLSAADYVHALADDPGTKVIALYIEGVRDGAKFVAAVAAAKRAGKPVVVLKGGLTAASARAAAAHTGAFTGEGRVWQAVARECGIITVKSLEELLDVSLYLASVDHAKLPRGHGVATLSFGGGNGVLSADQCVGHGLSIVGLQENTLAALKPILPPIASVENPIDLTPATFNQDQWFANFAKALDIVAADPSVDTVFCQFGPMARRGIDTAHELTRLRARTDKALCVAWPLSPPGVAEALRSDGFHVFQEYERALAVIGKVASAGPAAPVAVSRTKRPADLRNWYAALGAPAAGTVISEHDCHRVLRAAGVATAAGRLATSADDAVAAAAEVGLPVAMKGISPQVTHRAAAGLLALDLRTADDVRQTYGLLAEKAAKSGIKIDGLYVQNMVRGGIEIIVSAFRDPVFGVMVSCGAGGNMTEIIDDVVLARAPLDMGAAQAMLSRLRIVQGAAKLDPAARLSDLADFVAHFSEVATAAPWQQFTIEINPVKWRAGDVVAVDGLILVERP